MKPTLSRSAASSTTDIGTCTLVVVGNVTRVLESAYGDSSRQHKISLGRIKARGGGAGVDRRHRSEAPIASLLRNCMSRPFFA